MVKRVKENIEINKDKHNKTKNSLKTFKLA